MASSDKGKSGDPGGRAVSTGNATVGRKKHPKTKWFGSSLREIVVCPRLFHGLLLKATPSVILTIEWTSHALKQVFKLSNFLMRRTHVLGYGYVPRKRWFCFCLFDSSLEAEGSEFMRKFMT